MHCEVDSPAIHKFPGLDRSWELILSSSHSCVGVVLTWLNSVKTCMSNPAGFVWQVAKLAVGSSVAIFWMFRKVHKLFDPIELNNGSLAYVKVGAFYFLMTGCTLD